jgi:hypothetical protein
LFLGQAIDLALILGIHSQREKPELFCWITVAIEAGMAGHEVE